MPSKRTKPPAKGLTPRQKKFCQHYVVHLNGSQAATEAGYSAKTAREQAHDLLTRPHIQAFVKSLQEKLQEKTNIRAEDVINELAKCGFSNLRDFLDDDNSIRDLSKMPLDKTAAIESIKTIETTHQVKGKPVTKKATSFSLTDKISALEKLGRHLGIFEKDNKQQRDRIIMMNDIPKRKSE